MEAAEEIEAYFKLPTTKVPGSLCPFPLCLRKFAARNKTNAVEHILCVHVGIENHHCSKCSKVFATAKKLRRHVILRHNVPGRFDLLSSSLAPSTPTNERPAEPRLAPLELPPGTLDSWVSLIEVSAPSPPPPLFLSSSRVITRHTDIQQRNLEQAAMEVQRHFTAPNCMARLALFPFPNCDTKLSPSHRMDAMEHVLRVHVRFKVSTCPHCNKSFYTQKTARRHLFDVHRDLPSSLVPFHTPLLLEGSNNDFAQNSDALDFTFGDSAILDLADSVPIPYLIE